MLEAILSHLNNWFAAPGGRHRGTFRIDCGVLEAGFLREGQYFRIRGSVYNDGLHRAAGRAVPASTSDEAGVESGDIAHGAGAEEEGGRDPLSRLRDETFTGEIWALAVPPGIVALAAEIAAWREKNPETDRVSESFGGYSYSRGNAGTASGGAVGGWQAAFASRLSPYRRAYDD